MKYTKEKFIFGLKSYLANLFLIWFLILFYRYNKYYSKLLFSSTQELLFWLAVLYSLFGFCVYILWPRKDKTKSKGLITFEVIGRSVMSLWRYLRDTSGSIRKFSLKVSSEEKITILFILVKIFFLPLMFNFTFGNLSSLFGHLKDFPGITSIFQIDVFNGFTYAFLLSLFFLVDTLYFTFGYSFEANFLKNKVRSVEPTLFGWLVALICYPPFNSIIQQYTSWYASDFVSFGSAGINYLMRIILLVTFFVYVWATIALGSKSSNLTNRGIVAKGPYRFVRHPAYFSKNLFWWITIIPIINFPAILSMSVWSYIYFLRAITEEKHLMKDPDYVEYCKKVKYRFIPYVI